MGLAREWLSKMKTKPALTPEGLVPRLGETLVESGVISRAALETALQKQKQILESGEQPPLLGEILIEMGAVTRTQLDGAITEQILQLRTALLNANRMLEQRVEERTHELEQAMQKLAELNQLKSNFVSNISHELLTPLTHIHGYLEMMQNGETGPVNQEQQHSLEVMLKASNRLEQLIHDLIYFAESEHGRLHLSKQLIEVNDLCAGALQKEQHKALEKGITIQKDCHPGLPLVEGDQAKLLWVVMQLLDNAIKFTGKGGKVRLSTGLMEQENTVAITVSDTGIGISPENIRVIFEPFRQLDGSAARSSSGTGLGLALAQKIIDAHGSQLFVTSVVGEGSVFGFALPVASGIRRRSSESE
jgi:signal transduction histidine kinase